MPSFSDSIFLFVLALLLFGPKKLPVLARELGKWVGEFRRASNEFKMQMEDELRVSEQADRQKQIAAMEAAAPVAPALPEPEHPHLPTYTAEPTPVEDTIAAAEFTPPPVTPLPIATSGELSIMPPSTGLPTPQTIQPKPAEAINGLLNSIPFVCPEDARSQALAAEAAARAQTAQTSAQLEETPAHAD